MITLSKIRKHGTLCAVFSIVLGFFVADVYGRHVQGGLGLYMPHSIAFMMYPLVMTIIESMKIWWLKDLKINVPVKFLVLMTSLIMIIYGCIAIGTQLFYTVFLWPDTIPQWFVDDYNRRGLVAEAIQLLFCSIAWLSNDGGYKFFDTDGWVDNFLNTPISQFSNGNTSDHLRN